MVGSAHRLGDGHALLLALEPQFVPASSKPDRLVDVFHAPGVGQLRTVFLVAPILQPPGILSHVALSGLGILLILPTALHLELIPVRLPVGLPVGILGTHHRALVIKLLHLVAVRQCALGILQAPHAPVLPPILLLYGRCHPHEWRRNSPAEATVGLPGLHRIAELELVELLLFLELLEAKAGLHLGPLDPSQPTCRSIALQCAVGALVVLRCSCVEGQAGQGLGGDHPVSRGSYIFLNILQSLLRQSQTLPSTVLAE